MEDVDIGRIQQEGNQQQYMRAREEREVKGSKERRRKDMRSKEKVEIRTKAPPGGHLEIYRSTSLSLTWCAHHNKTSVQRDRTRHISQAIILCIMLLFC